jgi:hypothetical protein
MGAAGWLRVLVAGGLRALITGCGIAALASAEARAGASCTDGGAGAVAMPASSGPFLDAITVRVGAWARAPQPGTDISAVIIRPPGGADTTGRQLLHVMTAPDPVPTPPAESVAQPAIVYAPGMGPWRLPSRAPSESAQSVSAVPDIGGSERQALSGALGLPVSGARVTSGFGWRIHPVLRVRKFHYGIDLGAPIGTPVRATSAGTVVSCGRDAIAGLFVRLRHDEHLMTLYAHVAGFATGLRLGQQVQASEVIAYVGSTGQSTGPHLYYEVRVDGRAIDPLQTLLQGGLNMPLAPRAPDREPG